MCCLQQSALTTDWCKMSRVKIHTAKTFSPYVSWQVPYVYWPKTIYIRHLSVYGYQRLGKSIYILNSQYVYWTRKLDQFRHKIHTVKTFSPYVSWSSQDTYGENFFTVCILTSAVCILTKFPYGRLHIYLKYLAVYVITFPSVLIVLQFWSCF